MSVELQQILYIVSAALIVIGLLGVFLPVLPGIPLAFVGMVLAAWVGGFKEISVLVLILLGLLTAASLAIDFLASALGAKRAGASKMAIVGAGLGSLVGMIFSACPALFSGLSLA